MTESKFLRRAGTSLGSPTAQGWAAVRRREEGAPGQAREGGPAAAAAGTARPGAGVCAPCACQIGLSQKTHQNLGGQWHNVKGTANLIMHTNGRENFCLLDRFQR